MGPSKMLRKGRQRIRLPKEVSQKEDLRRPMEGQVDEQTEDF